MRYWVLVFAAVACTACGSSTVTPPDARIIEFGPDELSAAYRDATCQRLVRCGAFATVAGCAASDLGSLPIPEARCSQAGVDAGTVHWDSSAAHACVADTLAQSCEVGQAAALSCLHIAYGDEPRGDPGASCIEPGDCVENTDCLQSAPGHGQPRCTFAGWLGATCYPGVPTCNSGLTCTEYSCRGGATHGADCTASGTCQDLGDGCSNGLCTAFALEGEACGADAPCSPYLTCDATQHCAVVPAAPAPCH